VTIFAPAIQKQRSFKTFRKYEKFLKINLNNVVKGCSFAIRFKNETESKTFLKKYQKNLLVIKKEVLLLPPL